MRSKYQQAIIPPQPWTNRRPSTIAQQCIGPQYPTRLTVPEKLATPWGTGELHHATDTYVVRTAQGPFAVGIIKEVKPEPRRVVIVCE